MVMKNEPDFVVDLVEQLTRSPDVKESVQHKLKVYTQLKYGLIGLMFCIAKKERRAEASKSGELKGSAQVVIQSDGWMRLYEGADKEAPGVVPVLLPYIKPGTRWRFENGPDGEQVCVERPEFNEYLIYAVLSKPLYQPMKEVTEGQISLMEAKAEVREGEGLIDSFIRGLLTLAVNMCWEHQVTQNLDMVIKAVRESAGEVTETTNFINKAKRSESNQMCNLTFEEKMFAMRGALICLNDANMAKRSARRNESAQPNLKMAETEMGRRNGNNVDEDADRILRPTRPFRETRGTASFEDLADMLLTQSGSADLARADGFAEIDTGDRFAEIEY